MRLELKQKTYIVENYKVFGSFSRFARAYRKEFKIRKAPKFDTCKAILEKFKSTGSVDDLPRSGAPKTATTDDIVEECRVLLEDTAGMSLRRTALATGISYGSAQTIATTILNLYPYRIQLLHELKPTDFDRRKKFAEWFRDTPYVDYYFIASDEAYFHMDGNVNNYNFRIWSQENPNFVVEKQLKPKKVLVWCAMSKKKIIGPFFFDSSVKADNYLKMLKEFFWPEHKKQKLYKSYYFQQDGAPAHKALSVQVWLKERFGDKFLETGRWPPRSPDLNPCDFFLWGHLKDKVYVKRYETIDELKGAITDEIRKISKMTLFKVFEDMKKRCLKCIDVNGGHVE